jgi:transcriptional regulator with XRE-family HTH domain
MAVRGILRFRGRPAITREVSARTARLNILPGMSDRRHEPSLFRVLLRHNRQRRGMSQLDLSIAAEVSARHISFLETGRAAPSRDMVLRLCAALGLGLRETNELLSAAGMPRAFAETAPDEAWPEPIERVIAQMLKQQEPYPMVVLNARYEVLRTNRAANALLARYVHDATALKAPLNVYHALFNPLLFRPYVENWPQLAQLMLTQLQRDALTRPTDSAIPELVRELFNYPDVPEGWRQPALDLPPTAAFEFGLARDGQRVRFLTTLTTFNSALDVSLEDLKLESYFPADPATEAVCRSMAAAGA